MISHFNDRNIEAHKGYFQSKREAESPIFSTFMLLLFLLFLIIDLGTVILLLVDHSIWWLYFMALGFGLTLLPIIMGIRLFFRLAFPFCVTIENRGNVLVYSIANGIIRYSMPITSNHYIFINYYETSHNGGIYSVTLRKDKSLFSNIIVESTQVANVSNAKKKANAICELLIQCGFEIEINCELS